MKIEIFPEAASPYARWEAGELSGRDAAAAIAQELITEIELAEHALEARKKHRRPQRAIVATPPRRLTPRM